jgi:hypothetical protein
MPLYLRHGPRETRSSGSRVCPDSYATIRPSVGHLPNNDRILHPSGGPIQGFYNSQVKMFCSRSFAAAVTVEKRPFEGRVKSP